MNPTAFFLRRLGRGHVATFRFVAVLAATLFSFRPAHAQVINDPVTVPVQFQGMFNTFSNSAAVSISQDGVNTATGSSGPGTGILTSHGLARLRPGRVYAFTISTQNLTRLSVKITAPTAYRVFINDIEQEMFVWNPSGSSAFLPPNGAFRVRIDDGSGAPVGQASSLRPGRVLWSVGLGNLRNGKPAGSLHLAEDGLTANAYKPGALFFDRDGIGVNGTYAGSDPDVIIVKANNVLRQIDVPAALVDIVPANDYTYHVRFYRRDAGQVGAWNSGTGLYPVSGTPLYEFKVENPTYPATDALRITKITNQNGELITWTEMKKDTSQPMGIVRWRIHDWYEKNAGETTVTSPIQQQWTYTNFGKTETIEIMDGAGVVAQKMVKTYEDVNFGPHISLELVTETSGEGANAITTSYTYHTDPAVRGNWLRVKSSSCNDGSWTAFGYHDDFRNRGQLRQLRRPHKNLPAADPGLNANTGEVTTFTYDFTDYFGTNKLPTRIETKVDGNVTARSETAYTYETFVDQSASYSSAGFANLDLTVATRKDYFNNTQYLTTVTKTYREDCDYQYRFFRGLFHSIQRPDKTMTVTAYFQAAFTGMTWVPLIGGEGRAHLTIHGTNDTALGVSYSLSNAQPLGTNFRIVSGKSLASAIFYGGSGTAVVAEHSAYVGSQWTVTQQDWPAYADSFYPTTVSRRTGVAGATWLTANNTWTKGRVTTRADESGITETFTYNSVGRVETVVRAGASAAGSNIAAQTVTYLYNAAGQIISQKSEGAGSSEKILATREYDLAGRLKNESASGLGTTTYAYDPATRTTTSTLPTGFTRAETLFRDGRVAFTNGTAVVARYYDYSVAADGVRYGKVNSRSAADPRKLETWSDWLGRTTSTQRPGFTGQPNSAETMTYHPTSGQLQITTRTGYADTRYEYNSLGEVIRSGADLTGGGLQTASSDRIVDFDTSIEAYDGAYWVKSQQWIYPFTNSATARVANITRQRITGLSPTLRAEVRSWDIENNESRQTVEVDSTTKLATTTSTQPGLVGSHVSKSLNGFPISTTGHDGLVYKTGYDPLGRLATSVDPRTGTITTSYHLDTALPKETIDAAGKRLAYTSYDGAGRPSIVYDAFNKTTRFAYNALGQVEFQWGSGTHPSSFLYDTYGQRTKLRTYQDLGNAVNWDSPTWPGGSAAYSETEWEFDNPSGLLRKKYDHNRAFTEYTYNQRGQTYQRFWSRTYNGQRVSTTYGYDGSTGELTSVAYNDTTPGVTYAYDRLGQTDAVTDYTGARDFVYDPSLPWRLSGEGLSSFYGSRVLSPTYQSSTTTNTGDASYTGHTIGSVLGRANGFRLGSVTTPAADLEYTYVASSAGRIAGLVAKRGNGAASRQFVYGYETNSVLLKSLSVVGSPFYVERAYEPNRDLLTRIESKWSAATRTRYDYTNDDRRQRSSAIQSGDAYADYGNSVSQVFSYNDRGELGSVGGAKAAATYMGTGTTAPMSARQHDYDYDAAGNRKWSNTSGVAGLRDDYTVNALNQYSAKENNTLSAGGVADPGAKVVAGPTPPGLAGRAGRHWGDNVIPPNNTKPFYGSVVAYSVLLGAAPGGKDLFRTESKIGFIPAAGQSFSYDADGNPTNDGVWDYQWDAENRLIRLTPTTNAVSGGVPNRAIEFRYDYQHRRVQKRVLDLVNGGAMISERRYLYAGSNLLAEFDAGGALKRSYTWGLDLTGSLSATGGVGAMVQIHDHDVGKTLFPTYDGNGNVAALLNTDTGALEAAYEYSPFGELLRCDGSYAKENPIRFSTKFTDEETGLVYYGARYYSPSLGRFINRDPIEEAGGPNLYGFCANDGVNRTDYLGYEPGRPTGGPFDGPITIITFDDFDDYVNISRPQPTPVADSTTVAKAKTTTPTVIKIQVASSTIGVAEGKAAQIDDGNVSSRLAIGGTITAGASTSAVEGGGVSLEVALERAGIRAAQLRGPASLLSRLNPLVFIAALLTPTTAQAPGIENFPRVTIRDGFVIPNGANPDLVAEFFRLREQNSQRAREVLMEIWNEEDIQRAFPSSLHVPRGFKNQAQFDQALAELRAALKKSGITDGVVGVRGSSITGISSNPNSSSYGQLFGPKSDVDVFVMSSQIADAFGGKGFVHPDQLVDAYPALEAWSKKWAQELGRPITPAGWKPGSLPDTPAIFRK